MYVKIRDARSLFVCWTVMAACRGSSSKWFFTREQLETTPSRRCGMEPDRELSYRQQAANLIQDMGQRLNVYPSDVLINSRPISVSLCVCLFYLHTCNICHFCLSLISVIAVNSAEITRDCQFNPYASSLRLSCADACWLMLMFYKWLTYNLYIYITLHVSYLAITSHVQ